MCDRICLSSRGKIGRDVEISEEARVTTEPHRRQAGLSIYALEKTTDLLPELSLLGSVMLTYLLTR